MTRIIFILLYVLCMQAARGQFFQEDRNVEQFDGYFDFYYDSGRDKVFLQVKELNNDFLYVHALSEGLGSNDIGLDRGQFGDGVVVSFKRAGNKLLLIQHNQRYRAITENPFERKSVEEAFAKSVLFGFEILEEHDGHILIDITDFLIRDAHQVTEKLKSLDQGNFKLDKSRSAIHLERTNAFPMNVEFDVLLTFTGQGKGMELMSVSPDPNSVSVYQHHSFVKLPGPGFKPRVFDPRSGSFPMSFMDYASPITEPIKKRFIYRHRLEKKNPDQVRSEAKEPIVYYLDPGTPEPVRSALLEGASWWNQAFEASGYMNAFQVKMLPDDADPLDLRYNVIQWVHRSTRGWSYGNTIADPRTGEIIKGHVSLGSLRIRQDFLIASALEPLYANGEVNDGIALDMALARIRQLSAHEVGHTLGFAHNFTASVNNRSSVMDYPHPLITIKNRKLDFSSAYAKGIGDWDKITVAYSYKEFGGQEQDSLKQLLDKANANGHQFLTDADARPPGSSHPNAHLWDNGNDIVAELNNVMKVRNFAIDRFSADHIRNGQAFAELEDVFVPLYFYHRYQTEAVCKLLGGLNYNYAVRDGKQPVIDPVPAKRQEEALKALMETVSASSLKIPKEILSLFPPRAFGFPRTRESFRSNLGEEFDPFAPVAMASGHTFSLILNPQRISRLVVHKILDDQQFGFESMWDIMVEQTFGAQATDAYSRAVQNVINRQLLYSMFEMLADKSINVQAKASGFVMLRELQQEIETKKAGSRVQSEMNSYFSEQIGDFLKEPSKWVKPDELIMPDGSPIGSY